MIKFLIHRIFASIPVVLGVCTLTFFLIHLVPGDPIDIMLGEQASEIDREALRADLRLNLPLHIQYFEFVKRVVRFDLGKSLHKRQPVSTELLERFPATLELTCAAMFLALLAGVPMGVGAAVRRSSWPDHLVTLTGLLSMSTPGIFLGPLLIWVFALQLDLFPVSERGGLNHLILPALSLAIPICAVISRMTRMSMLEVVREDYIRVARAKGLTPFYIYGKHALANALMPLITIVGLQVGALLTGTVITETIFDWPGIGTLLIQAIQSRDYPLVQGCVLLISLIYVSVNTATDIAYGFANPKVRLT